MKSRSKFVITVVVFLVLLLSGFLYYQEGSLPVDKADKESTIFVIQPGDGPIAIAQKLENANLIRNRIVFYLEVKRLGIEKNIQAGDFRLSRSMNAAEIAQTFTKGSIDQWVTIIEGQRKEEVADILSSNLGLSASEFLAEAQEGYLFPDTYLIPKDASAAAVIDIFKNNFNSKLTPELKAKAMKNGLTENELVTLASLVEKEALNHDRVEIASIMLRRLEEGHKLQIDATVQYALGYQPNEKRWWKKAITFDDLEVDSPYNTYQNAGLPPAPIASPGRASLEAVANATPETPYLFYIHDITGRTHYARNAEEHQRNIDKYLK